MPGERREALVLRAAATPSRAADFFFVEAHTAGGRRLDDAARPARATPRRCTGYDCDGALKLHPFLRHYLRLRTSAAACSRGHDRRAGGRRAGRATATSAGSSISRRYAGKPRRGLADATSATTPDQYGGVDVDDVPCPAAPRLDVVRGRRRHARRLDRPRRAAPAARPNPNDWIAATVERGAADASATSRRSARSHASPRSSRFLAGLFGPYPFSAGRLDRRRRPRPRLRAREPDAPDLLARVLRGRRRRGRTRSWSSTSSPTSGSATPAARRLAQHLAQRGLRDLHRVALERAPRALTAQAIFDAYAPHARRRSACWRVKIGDPGPRRPASTPRSTTAAR